MASPSEKLTESLQVLRNLQQAGVVAIRSSHLTRTHRQRLVKNGFLQEVMKGWYVSARPDEEKGDSTTWYTSFRRTKKPGQIYLWTNDWKPGQIYLWTND